MVPLTSPSEISPALPRSTTVSPSSRKVRSLPSASGSGSRPPHVSSIRLPIVPGSAPEIVPEAKRSPGRAVAPLTVAWASCCGNVQYRPRALVRETIVPFSSTSSSMSSAQSPSVRRYSSGSGSWGGAGTR